MNQKIKTLQIIHLALIASVSFCYIILGNLGNALNLKIDTSSLPFALIPLAAYYVGNIMFKMVMKNVKQNSTTEEKLTIYQSASIIRWAILEIGCFAILFIKPDFILLGMVILLYMYFTRPTKDKAIQLLNIKRSELEQ